MALANEEFFWRQILFCCFIYFLNDDIHHSRHPFALRSASFSPCHSKKKSKGCCAAAVDALIPLGPAIYTRRLWLNGCISGTHVSTVVNPESDKQTRTI